MPATFDLIFYVALSAGSLMLVAASIVYVVRKQADRGTLGFCLIAALLICIGLIAKFKVSSDEKGWYAELETSKAVQAITTETAGSLTESQAALQQAQTRLENQLSAANARQDEIAAAVARLQQQSNPEGPLLSPNFEPDLPECTDSFIETRNKKTKELAEKEKALNNEINRFRNAAVDGHYTIETGGIPISSSAIDAAIKAQIQALQAQRAAVMSDIWRLGLMRCQNKK